VHDIGIHARCGDDWFVTRGRAIFSDALFWASMAQAEPVKSLFRDDAIVWFLSVDADDTMLELGQAAVDTLDSVKVALKGANMIARQSMIV